MHPVGATEHLQSWQRRCPAASGPEINDTAMAAEFSAAVDELSDCRGYPTAPLGEGRGHSGLTCHLQHSGTHRVWMLWGVAVPDCEETGDVVPSL